MNAACQQFAGSIARLSAGSEIAYSKAALQWTLEDAPATVVFGYFGDSIAEDFDAMDAEARHRIFRFVEEGMCSGDVGLLTAVATGLVEALANEAVRRGDLWERMWPHLGARTLAHARAWLDC